MCIYYRFISSVRIYIYTHAFICIILLISNYAVDRLLSFLFLLLLFQLIHFRSLHGTILLSYLFDPLNFEYRTCFLFKKKITFFFAVVFLVIDRSIYIYIYFKLLTTFKNNLSTNLVSYTLKNVLFSSSHYKVEASQFLIDSNQCIDFSSSIICCCFTFF